MLRPLPALLGEQMVGEIGGQTLAPVSACRSDENAVAPPIVQQFVRIGRGQNKRKPDDLLAQQRKRRHAVAGFPKILHKGEFGIRVRAQKIAIHIQILRRGVEITLRQRRIGFAQERVGFHRAGVLGIFRKGCGDEMHLFGRRRHRPPFRKPSPACGGRQGGGRCGRAFALADRFPPCRQIDRKRVGNERIPGLRHPMGRTGEIRAAGFDQSGRFAKRTGIFATRCPDRIVDDTLIIEFAGQFLAGRSALDTIDVDRHAGRRIAIVAVDAGAGFRHTRPGRDQRQPGRCVDLKIGVQRQRERRGHQRAGNADTIAHLEAVACRVERHGKIVMDHRVRRPLRRRGGSHDRAKRGRNGNAHHRRKDFSHGITSAHEGRSIASRQCLGPMFSEEISIT